VFRARLAFAVSFSNHGFDLAVERVAAEVPQSVAQFCRLYAVASIVVELGEQSLVYYATSSQCFHVVGLLVSMDSAIALITGNLPENFTAN